MADLEIQQEFRDSLDEEIFDTIGKSVTLVTIGSEEYNDRGELEDSTNVSTTIIAVPYNIVNDRQSNQQFGEMEEGDMDMVLRYDQVVAIDDYFIIDSQDYKVKEIQKNYLPDNVATIVRITKTEPLESND
jgi:sporulation protein YlmC with PRC-barrel domain